MTPTGIGLVGSTTFTLFGEADLSPEDVTTRQYARLEGAWIASIGLDPPKFRGAFAAPDQSYFDLPAQGTSGHFNFCLDISGWKAQVRYLGLEIGDAIEIAEKIDL
jgi:hypothetical protein